MAPPTVPVGEPLVVQAGSDVVFDTPVVSDPDLGTFTPADGWALTYYLTAGKGQVVAIASVVGGTWRVTIPNSDTTKLKSGCDPETVTWAAKASQGSESYLVRSGSLSLLADPTTLSSGLQAWAQQALDLVKALLLKRYAQDVSALSVQQRQLQREEIKTLESLRGKYSREVGALRTGGFGQAIKFRMVRTS
jgi:hypothetical protein